MKKLIINNKIIPNTKNCHFRFVEESDASYILQLRLDEKYNKYLSKVDDDLSNQVEWIKSYKKREKLLKELYIVVENKLEERVGIFRLYDLKEDSFTCGSWIMTSEAANSAAIETLLIIYFIGFEVLKYSKTLFDVRNENMKIISFHKKFGARQVGVDELNHYFKFEKEDYMKAKVKYERYLRVIY